MNILEGNFIKERTVGLNRERQIQSLKAFSEDEVVGFCLKSEVSFSKPCLPSQPSVKRGLPLHLIYTSPLQRPPHPLPLSSDILVIVDMFVTKC
jgi:hypothetical protein